MTQSTDSWKKIVINWKGSTWYGARYCKTPSKDIWYNLICLEATSQYITEKQGRQREQGRGKEVGEKVYKR